jgi:AraC-like DNA-binding protein
MSAMPGPAAPMVDCGVRVLWVARFDYAPGQRIGAHRHPDHHQIFHVLDGDARFQLDGHELPLGAGATLLVQPGALHAMRVAGRRSVRTLDCKFRVHAPDLRRWTRKLPAQPSAQPETVRAPLARIRAVADAGTAVSSGLCDALLLQLLLELAPGAPARPGPRSVLPEPSGDPIADGLLAWLLANHGEPVDGRGMARATGYSYRHLAAACRRGFSCTPRDLLRRVRVGAAMRLLLEDPRPAANLLVAAGFASAAHGTRIFARLAGLAPAAWRARERDGIGRGSVLDPGFADRDWVRATRPGS